MFQPPHHCNDEMCNITVSFHARRLQCTTKCLCYMCALHMPHCMCVRPHVPAFLWFLFVMDLFKRDFALVLIQVEYSRMDMPCLWLHEFQLPMLISNRHGSSVKNTIC